MSTRLYLVRHGATRSTTEDRFSGADDVELSNEGRFQVQHLAERLADDNIAAVFSSPLIRTMDTARIIAGPHGLVPTSKDGLREISHGHWEGKSRKEVEAQFLDEYNAWEADPFTFAPRDGESGLTVLARALPVIREVLEQYEGQNVLVVSHKATIRILVSSFLGFEMRGYRDRLDQAPAGLNILDFKDPIRARLMLFNDVSHYTDQPKRPLAHLSKWWDGTSS